MIPGALSTILFVYLQGYAYYRKYYLKDEKKDKTDAEKLDENVDLLSEAAV